METDAQRANRLDAEVVQLRVERAFWRHQTLYRTRAMAWQALTVAFMVTVSLLCVATACGWLHMSWYGPLGWLNR